MSGARGASTVFFAFKWFTVRCDRHSGILSSVIVFSVSHEIVGRAF